MVWEESFGSCESQKAEINSTDLVQTGQMGSNGSSQPEVRPQGLLVSSIWHMLFNLI